MASKDFTSKWLLPSVKPTLVVLIIFMPAPGSAINVTCSEPNQPALLEALTPLFNLSAIRPVQHASTCTNISISFTVYAILGVDEKAQLLNTFIWSNFWWRNEFVSWDPVQCGTEKISLLRSKFWIPDLVINEFMDENTAPPIPYLHLHSDGFVHDAYPIKIVSSCNLDTYVFPFDIQNCSLTFNSYIHYAMDIKLFLGVPAKNITERSKSVMTTLGEWELLDITSHDKKHNDARFTDTLEFHIILKRRATLYVVNLLIPSCFLITVDLFSFLLPPQSVDRSSFKMTLILGYTVFLLIMNDLLPITGNTIPLLNVFFSLCLALMVASLLETILITNLLSGSADFRPVPRWIQVLVLQILGPLVFLPQKTKKLRDSGLTVVVKSENNVGPPEIRGPAVEGKAVQALKNLGKDLHAIRLQVDQQLSKSPSSEEWMQVGFIIDRLLFGIYIFFITISFITIIIIWCCPLKVKPSKLLFIFIFVLMCDPSSSVMPPCSRPDPPSLLEALKPVFNMSAIRPVINLSTTTNVSLTFTLFGILGVDEKAQLLTTYIWQILMWKNEFVKWDPDECGSELITVPRKQLWVPDVIINEFMEENSAVYVPYTYLFYNGMVIDEQPVRVVSSCRLDIYTFPFDIQNCTLSFNSYTYYRSDVNIELMFSTEDIYFHSKEVMATMGEWEFIGITMKILENRGSTGDLYEELRFYISLKRRATLYVLNILIPSCFLITVDLFSFMLPPKNVDRSLFKMTLILGYTVFLLMMNDLLPITGNTIPLINVFLSLCLGLMVASLLETIIITNLLCGSAHYSPAPRWIRVFVLHILGRLVCLPPKPRDQEDTIIQNPAAQVEMKVSSLVTEDSEGPEQNGPLNEEETLQELRSLGMDLQAIRLQVEQHQLSGQKTEDWIQVGFIIDRLLFIFYIIFISASFITIIFFWRNHTT